MNKWKLSGLIGFLMSLLCLFSENCIPYAQAASRDFHCDELNQAIFARHGLPGVAEIAAQSDTVCQTYYRGSNIIISSVKSEHILQLRHSDKFQTSHYRLGHYDVLITTPSQQGCAHVIINRKQLITVISPYCALTRKTVSVIVHVLG